MDQIHKDLITKRFQTTMIGALYNFEETFGYLWGLDEDEDRLSNEQIHFRDKWEDVRNAILNNGNNQLRKCLADIDKTQSFKYKYSFKQNKKGYE